MSQRKNVHHLLLVLLATTLLGSCGNDSATSAPAQQSAAAPAQPGTTGANAPAPAEPSLIGANISAPTDISLAVQNVAGFPLNLPTGGDWQSENMGMGMRFRSDSLNITVMIQRQNGVPAEARADYTDSFVQANTRDAPQYRVTARGLGTVSNHPAARVDGSFNNGTAFSTRDYVVFVRNGALAVMARGPEADAARVQALADAIANSIGS